MIHHPESAKRTHPTSSAHTSTAKCYTLHELRQARDLRDAQRVKALQAVLWDTAQQIGLPFHVAGTVAVPNLSATQKTVITNNYETFFATAP